MKIKAKIHKQSIIIVAVCIIIICACAIGYNCKIDGKNGGKKNSEPTVHTSAGDVSVDGLVNISKYENNVINKYKLSDAKNKEITDEIDKLKDGRAKESEILSIENKYGSIDKYENKLIYDAKYNSIYEEATKNISVTEDDCKKFLENYTDTFAHDNVIIIGFKSKDSASQFYNEYKLESNADILKHIKDVCSAYGEVNEYPDINKYTKNTGITLYYSVNSDRYVYVEDRESMKERFNSLQDGQMCEPFEYMGEWAVLKRVSSGTIEADDALVKNYELEIKKGEAYNKYIVDNK